ncbi:MAG: polysaccharide deacetylase family protein [Actinomycetota bacterium]
MTTKKLTLTFDNGPDPDVTPQVVAELGRRGITATFFVLGRLLSEETLPVVRAVVEAGHAVGNHTFSHPRPFGGLSGEAAVFENFLKSALRNKRIFIVRTRFLAGGLVLK